MLERWNLCADIVSELLNQQLITVQTTAIELVTMLRNVDTLSEWQCGFQPEDKTYAPCTQQKGHSGPCAHPLKEQR